jgi:hypothetical protein
MGSRIEANAALETERASLETEATPVRYVAKLIGAGTKGERAIRLLIALMVLCCDPLAIALTGAATNRCLKPHLVRSTFESCRAQPVEGHGGYGPSSHSPAATQIRQRVTQRRAQDRRL